MKAVLSLAAALALAASGASLAQDSDTGDLTTIDTPASTLEQILGQSVELPGEAQEVRVVEATLEPNTAAAWHSHPTPVYVYVTEGTLTMEVEGRELRRLTAGEATAEPLDARMRVLNEEDIPAKVVVFQISPAEKEFLETETK
ncbi:cupin domain-containing protein [Salinarimonas sp.]|uniref:cupin domain-containing protein n=1 Tax=Salinarimonas sp. TaxID=2766526 RepID=UPI0032D9A478